MRADEYVVEELLKLKEENEQLRKENHALNSMIKDAEKNADFWADAYQDLIKEIERLKEITKPEIRDDGDVKFNEWYFSNYDEKINNFVKEFFGLKENNEEEGEKKDE